MLKFHLSRAAQHRRWLSSTIGVNKTVGESPLLRHINGNLYPGPQQHPDYQSTPASATFPWPSTKTPSHGWSDNHKLSYSNFWDLRERLESGDVYLERVCKELSRRISYLNPHYGALVQTLDISNSDNEQPIVNLPGRGLFFCCKDGAPDQKHAKLGSFEGNYLSLLEEIARMKKCENENCPRLSGKWCFCASLSTSRYIAKLTASGALCVGAGNVPPHYNSNETNSPHLVNASRNGVHPELTVGGSSGGSALAVQLGFCHIGLGTDGAGSIRLPAAYTGTIGVKPAAFPIFTDDGGMGFFFSRAKGTNGMIGRNVADIALAIDIMHGTDMVAKTRKSGAPSARVCVVSCHPAVREYQDRSITHSIETLAEGLRANGVGVHQHPEGKEPWSTDLRSSGIFWVSHFRAQDRAAREKAKLLGIDDADLQKLKLAEPWKEVFMKKHFNQLSEDDIVRATLQRSDVQKAVIAQIKELFSSTGTDVLITPASPVLPWKLKGNGYPELPAGAKRCDPFVNLVLPNVYLYPFNWANYCAATFPCGVAYVDGRAIPVGAQIVVQTAENEATENPLLALEKLIQWLSWLSRFYEEPMRQTQPHFEYLN